MAEIAIINPRFEVSYWGMEHALPLLGSGPTAGGSTTLVGRTDSWEHEVTLVDRSPGARFRSAGSADIGLPHGHERAAVADARDPDGAERARAFTVVGGPWVSVQEDYFGELADVIFVGEAEETWPQFLQDWKQGRHQHRYEQPEKTDMTSAHSPLRSLEDAALPVRQRSFSRAARFSANSATLS